MTWRTLLLGSIGIALLVAAPAAADQKPPLSEPQLKLKAALYLKAKSASSNRCQTGSDCDLQCDRDLDQAIDSCLRENPGTLPTEDPIMEVCITYAFMDHLQCVYQSCDQIED